MPRRHGKGNAVSDGEKNPTARGKAQLNTELSFQENLIPTLPFYALNFSFQGHALLSYKYPESDVWSSGDITAYHQALMKYDKDFFKVGKI